MKFSSQRIFLRNHCTTRFYITNLFYTYYIEAFESLEKLGFGKFFDKNNKNSFLIEICKIQKIYTFRIIICHTKFCMCTANKCHINLSILSVNILLL